MLKSPGDAQDGHPFLLTTTAPSRDQRLLAAGVLVVMVGASLVTAPFSRIPLENSEVLVPAYAAAMLVNELITSALLFALYSVQRSRGVLALAIGYLFSGIMIVPWVFTFPGVFDRLEFFDPGLQGTAAIAVLRRIGFPLFVLAYAMLKDPKPSVPNPNGFVWITILCSVVGVVVIAFGLSWCIVISDDSLPKFMHDVRNVSQLWRFVPATALFLYLIALVVFYVRQRSVLDLWLMVVLCTLIVEVVHLSYLSSGLRLSVGWWTGRLFGLASASIVLLVLLSETTTLYGRLARSVSAERRARQDRLTVMEAMSASIAHEVNQPLASMVTNADAGLRWIGRENPDLEETRAALKRIVNDGHRAGKVIEGIRAMFKKSAQERVPLNLNRLIDDVLKRSESETRLGRVFVETDFDEALPHVTGNPIQLQQVVSNLVENAVDAMSAVTGRPRVLRVKSERHNSGAVMVSMEDSGTGLDPQYRDRIFEPFFTTKSDGMGMGLMFCRSIIEAHGGQLRTVESVMQGAKFELTLPGSGD